MAFLQIGFSQEKARCSIVRFLFMESLCQFLLDKERDKPDAKLRYRIKWNDNKNIVAFSVGYRIDIDKWSLETQRCKNNTTHGKKKIPASVINKKITHFEQLKDRVFNSFEIRGIIPSEDEFRNEFNRLNGKVKPKEIESHPKGFFEIFDEFVKTMGFKNSWTEATYTKFKAIRNHLQNFDNTLSFESLTEMKMHEYLHYLFGVPMRNTTISKHLEFFRWFLRWADDENYYKGKLHKTFKPKLKGSDGKGKVLIFFTWEELIYLLNYNFPDNKQYLARVRDVVCFCSFSSLRHSDAYKLERPDVKETYINVVTKKTDEYLKIELNKYSKSILDKYKDVPFPNNKALPVISLTNMNKYLKEMGELVGFDDPVRIVYFIGSERFEVVLPKYKLLSTHCGRRTFIVNALYLGIPAEVIMKWTGHEDYDSMKPYITIVDKLKAREMDKFNTFQVPTIQNRD